MAIYKDVEPLEVVSYQGENEDFDRGVKFILEKLDALPTADVVEVKSIEHLKWERDTAIKQLQSYGVGFGENKELAEVKHGEWKEIVAVCDIKFLKCSVCGMERPRLHTTYCCDCGAKMDGKRSENK